MTFLIIRDIGTRIVEADDFVDAVKQAYDDHLGYEMVQAIVKLPDSVVCMD